MTPATPATEMTDCSEKVQIGTFVSLCARQLNDAMHEAQSQTEALSDAVMRAHGTANAALGLETSSSAEEQRTRNEELVSATTSAAAQLQFMDRLGQRVANVCANIALLSELLGKGVQIENEDWGAFLELARSNYTMESERSSHDEAYGLASATCSIPEFDDSDGVLF